MHGPDALQQLGHDAVGPGQPPVVLGVRNVGALEHVSALPNPSWLRIAGTLPVTAQSPKDTSTRVRLRILPIRSRLSRLQMAPSTRQRSTPSGYSFTSITGL